MLNTYVNSQAENFLEVLKILINQFQNEDKRCESNIGNIIIINMANICLFHLLTKMEHNIDEDIIENILFHARQFCYPMVRSKADKTVLKNGKRSSKRIKLCPEEYKSKIATALDLFYDLLINLVSKSVLTENGISEMIRHGFLTLSKECCETFYLKAIRLISKIFMIYEYSRIAILDDIMIFMNKEITSEQGKYLSIHENSEVLLLTILVLSVFQSLPCLPSHQNLEVKHKKRKCKSIKNRKSSKDEQDDLINAYVFYMNLGENFVTNFFTKCYSTGEQFGVHLFTRFLDDIICMTKHIEWPSTNLFIGVLCQVLMRFVINKSKETYLRVVSFNFIAKIYEFLSSWIYPQRSLKGISDTFKISIDSIASCRMIIIKLLSQFGDEMNICNFLAAHWRYVDSFINKPSIFSVDQESDGAHFDQSVLQPELISQMYHFLSSSTWCMKVHEMLTNYMFQLASDDSVAIRLKSIQCFNYLVTLNPEFTKEETFVRLLKARMTDSAASVRSSVVELVGQVVLMFQNTMSPFFGDLSLCCMDVSISVRKQAVIIFKEFLLNHSEHFLICDVMSCLLNRLSDEEQVKKHVIEAFSIFLTGIHASEACRSFVKLFRDQHPNRDTFLSMENCFCILVMQEQNKFARKDRINKAFGDIFLEGIKTFLNSCQNFKLDDKNQILQKELFGCAAFLKILSSLKINYCLENHIGGILECCDFQLSNVLISSNVIQMNLDVNKLSAILLRLLTFPSAKIIDKSLRCIKVLVSNELFDCTPLVEFFVAMIECLEKKVEHDHRGDNRAKEHVNYIVKKDGESQQITTSLLIVGLFSKFFEPSLLKMKRIRVFEYFMHFAQSLDEEINLKSLYGLGYFLQRHSDLLIDKRLVELMLEILKSSHLSSSVICILKILLSFFKNHELKIWPKKYKVNGHLMSEEEKYESDSSIVSQVAQVFLKSLLIHFLNPNVLIRDVSFDVITSILHQGLIHPAMCLPYLICATSNPKDERNLRIKASNLLKSIHVKHSSIFGAFILPGLRLSYQLIVAVNAAGGKSARGYIETNKQFHSCLDVIFSLVHNNKVQYHNFIKCTLKCFSETNEWFLSQEFCTRELLYLADSLSCLPFSSLENILFLISNIDLILNNLGLNVLHDFLQILNVKQNSQKRDRNGKSITKLAKEGGTNLSSAMNAEVMPKIKGSQQLCEVSYEREQIKCVMANMSSNNFDKMLNICSLAHRCLLLIHLKNHLLRQFSIGDKLVQDYALANIKTSSKCVCQKVSEPYDPGTTVAFLSSMHDFDRIVDSLLELKNYFEA